MTAVIKTQGINMPDILVPFLKLLIIVALCFLFNQFVIEPLPLTEWLSLIVRCTIIPLIFIVSARLSGLHAITELKDLINGQISTRS